MSTYWCERAILGDPSAGRVECNVVVEESDGKISRIEADAAAPAHAKRLSGIVLPGLANSHSHAFHRVLRGAVERGGGDFWVWRDAMYAVAEALEPDSYRELCGAVFAEMAMAGITTVGEFHYVHHGRGGAPYADENAMSEALVLGAQAAGIRLSVIDCCYLEGGIGEPLAGAQLRFGDGSVERWAERVEKFAPTAGVRVCAGVHSVRALVPSDIEAVAAFARKQSLRLHFHLSEQPKENDESLGAYGRTPTELLDDCGALGHSSVAVHATFVSDRDIERLGSSSTTICLCPTTERDLGDGIGPADALSRAGSPLVIGSDSNATIDALAEARGIELDERLVKNRRAISQPEALLVAATSSGARALGWQEVGQLAVGFSCDLVALDAESPRLAGALEADAVAAVVFAACASDVTDVVVDGRVVVEARHHFAFEELGRSLAGAISRLRLAA